MCAKKENGTTMVSLFLARFYQSALAICYHWLPPRGSVQLVSTMDPFISKSMVRKVLGQRHDKIYTKTLRFTGYDLISSRLIRKYPTSEISVPNNERKRHAKSKWNTASDSVLAPASLRLNAAVWCQLQSNSFLWLATLNHSCPLQYTSVCLSLLHLLDMLQFCHIST